MHAAREGAKGYGNGPANGTSAPVTKAGASHAKGVEERPRALSVSWDVAGSKTVYIPMEEADASSDDWETDGHAAISQVGGRGGDAGHSTKRDNASVAVGGGGSAVTAVKAGASSSRPAVAKSKPVARNSSADAPVHNASVNPTAPSVLKPGSTKKSGIDGKSSLRVQSGAKPRVDDGSNQAAARTTDKGGDEESDTRKTPMASRTQLGAESRPDAGNRVWMPSLRNGRSAASA
eukprot:TRINITY_DN8800_c1_g1_i1.p2 TRINITY_DN8800_c1_g1~~TRINITY_DN8800_c1_g1_i1.p2  ORF type:complete len:254 (-),score=53.79 TRINITY_DN8800_c1_g1_i1:303-1004(-)